MMSQNKKTLPLIVFLYFLLTLPLARAQTTVFLKPADALKMIFKDSKEVHKEDHVVTPEIREKVKAILGYDLPNDEYTFFIGKTNGQIDGYAIIDQQVGKVLPITFITRISSKGTVEDVEVMVFRESRGGEVKYKRFLRQFENKKLNSELRLHKNIVNITGATMSSQAMVVGVKRALALWQVIYGNKVAQ